MFVRVRFNRLHRILQVSRFLFVCTLIYVYGRLSPFYPQQYYSIFLHRSLNINNANFMCKVTKGETADFKTSKTSRDFKRLPPM